MVDNYSLQVDHLDWQITLNTSYIWQMNSNTLCEMAIDTSIHGIPLLAIDYVKLWVLVIGPVG